ncbi:hypothetical protein J3R83DRAFT_4014 [Lanmaoa asiatica]|nr:hypothetical protein J3R83DRAFT_4014 [Lanmaoa asiatica]
MHFVSFGNPPPFLQRVGSHTPTVLFCSKEGAAQVRLKLSLVNDDAGHNFTFTTTPQEVAYAERETFKAELTNIISRNRSSGVLATATNAGAAQTPKGPVTAASTLTPSKAVTPAAFPTSRASTSRATSVVSDGRTPILSGQDAATDFRLRKRVLLANPELLALHKDLVMGGQITEAEFWEGREYLLLAEAATENQRRGRPGQLVDPRPQTVEGGEVKIVITPQLVHDIFEEFPVVAKAYSDNVPNNSSGNGTFQSKLFNAHRASIRSSATQHVVKEDPIFDKYLEKDDDELEPRRPRDEISDLYINLGATLEDHGETGNEKDVTMQAGRQRGALPLIRKFNEHSERLLNSAFYLVARDVPRSKRRRVNGGDGENPFSEIEYDDLQDHESSPGILLEMQDRQRYFEGQLGRVGTAGSGVEESRETADVKNAFKELLNGVNGWEARFGQLKVERKSSDAALLSMTQNVAARLDIKTRKPDFPPDLFRQLTTCQTAANEFLRQFWTSIYPPPSDLPTPTSTAVQRSAKAAKMAGYLGKTHQKVDALVRAAVLEGVEGNRIVVAMKPLMDAVEHALAFHRARSSAVGGGVSLERPGGVKFV